ncbi:serine/threonine-protein phosphatase 6 regulatory ankyrin repeat subunit C-like [Papaver somniferum]|uniref:serine/threonine-protein phosphatase 6 regulatory ankyrin repeat subunit C-like n=1 Tax=Papaver somniferum TaxID=3469 RepID=UPI000E6FB579|nr:serine/threonine-protein phosphatase 6 regulatory ankyrin repeat subunit C-like [Papaver somniferum]
MDRLVTVDAKELNLVFKPNQKCSTSFKLTNLMHTMSIAVSVTTTNPNLFSISQPFSVLSPLASSNFTLFLALPSELPQISSPIDSLHVRTTILPTGKANQDDLHRFFTKPGASHIFRDANLPISFVGEFVARFLISEPCFQTLESNFILSKAIGNCTKTQITSLLWYAVGKGNPRFVSALIDAGGDVNFRDLSNGKSLLFAAVNSAAINRVDLMGLFCEFGCLVNSVDSYGRTPIHVSAIHGNLDALKFCVSKGGDTDCVDNNGCTPLHCAASEGRRQVVEFLLECSSYSKYSINSDGKTPFLVAIDNGHSHLLDLLRLSDVLHRAATLGDVHGLRSCIEKGAIINSRDQNGWTALHRASFKGQTESVKLLMSNGAQVDLVDDAGYTPLHCATEAGHSEVASYLIKNGALANMKSLKGVSSLNLTSFQNHSAFKFPLCEEKELV